jgi:type III pantothenate kinase
MRSPPSLLAADVGNSRVKYGWFVAEASGTNGAWPVCQQFTATPLDAPVPVEQLRDWAEEPQPRLVLAGSNPDVVNRIARDWEDYPGQQSRVICNRSDLPLQVTVESPETVGLDRLLNAVAANALRPSGRAAIVIDSGTATTVDLITAHGEFAGGAILPGLALSAQALHHYTALLPLLSLSDLGPELPAALGRNTREALRSGIYWGQVGAIQQLVKSLIDTEGLAAPWLLLTGGGAQWLGEQFPGVRQIPSLAMHGLVLTAWQQDSVRGQVSGVS